MCPEPLRQTTLPELHPPRLFAHRVDENPHDLEFNELQPNLKEQAPVLQGQYPGLVGPLSGAEMPRH